MRTETFARAVCTAGLIAAFAAGGVTARPAFAAETDTTSIIQALENDAIKTQGETLPGTGDQDEPESDFDLVVGPDTAANKTFDLRGKGTDEKPYRVLVKGNVIFRNSQDIFTLGDGSYVEVAGAPESKITTACDGTGKAPSLFKSTGEGEVFLSLSNLTCSDTGRRFGVVSGRFDLLEVSDCQLAHYAQALDLTGGNSTWADTKITACGTQDRPVMDANGALDFDNVSIKPVNEYSKNDAVNPNEDPRGALGDGVRLSPSSRSLIRNSTIEGCQGSGVRAYGGTELDIRGYTLLDGNNLSKSETACDLYVDDAGSPKVGLVRLTPDLVGGVTCIFTSWKSIGDDTEHTVFTDVPSEKFAEQVKSGLSGFTLGYNPNGDPDASHGDTPEASVDYHGTIYVKRDAQQRTDETVPGETDKGNKNDDKTVKDGKDDQTTAKPAVASAPVTKGGAAKGTLANTGDRTAAIVAGTIAAGIAALAAGTVALRRRIARR